MLFVNSSWVLGLSQFLLESEIGLVSLFLESIWSTVGLVRLKELHDVLSIHPQLAVQLLIEMLKLAIHGSSSELSRVIAVEILINCTIARYKILLHDILGLASQLLLLFLPIQLGKAKPLWRIDFLTNILEALFLSFELLGYLVRIPSVCFDFIAASFIFSKCPFELQLHLLQQLVILTQILIAKLVLLVNILLARLLYFIESFTLLNFLLILVKKLLLIFNSIFFFSLFAVDLCFDKVLILWVILSKFLQK